MPENTEAWNLFWAVQTQWRAAGMGIIGLDYGEVRRSAKDLDIMLTPGMWRKIKALEAAELNRINGRQDSGNDD